MSFVEKDNYNQEVAAYFESDYFNKPKEQFKFIKKHIDKIAKKDKKAVLLDIGCAKGEFTLYLQKFYPNFTYYGVDLNRECIQIAQKKVKHAKFIQSDFLDAEFNKKVDIIVMSGFLAIFDNFSKILDKALALIKRGGFMLIFGAFNRKDIDVLTKFRNNKFSDIWQTNNIFSLETIKKYVIDKVSYFGYEKFNIPIDIKRNDNPIRSYTLKLEDRSRINITDAGIYYDFYLLKIKK